MNIMNYMEELGETPALSYDTIHNMMVFRKQTFKGFMEREQTKGIMFYPFDLRTPQGQDCARLMFWRTLEEYAESISAGTIEHRLEELIDSFNYASSAFYAPQDSVNPNSDQGMLLDPTVQLLHLAEGIFTRPVGMQARLDPTHYRLGEECYRLANVTDTFRNRAWMENSQDNYFTGLKMYQDALLNVMAVLMHGFESWPEFWRYFMAKDKVLQFRLRSNY